MNVEAKKKLSALAEGNAEYASFHRKIVKTEKIILALRSNVGK